MTSPRERAGASAAGDGPEPSAWRTIRQLPAGTSLDESIDRLVQAAQREADAPLVSVHLPGRTFRGWVVGVHRDERGRRIVMHVSDEAGRPSGDALWIEHAPICGITVHDAGRHAALVSGGCVRPVATGPAPTRLALTRQAADIEQRMTASLGVKLGIEWAGRGDDDGSRHALAVHLRLVDTVLASITEDTVGRKAVAALKQVRLVPGDEPKVRRAGDALIIADTPADAAPWRSASALRSAVEAVL